MNVIRLTTVAQIIRYRDFINNSLASISDKTREPFDDIKTLKTLVNLVVDQQRAWIGVALDESLMPWAFAVLQECTPEFDDNRYFVVRWFYHHPGQHVATTSLMAAFEQWARDNNIFTYAVTTRRSAGEAIRCFAAPRYGFHRHFWTFEKTLI